MISDFWTPELEENTFLLFQSSPLGALCYISPRKLTWPHGARLQVGPRVSIAVTPLSTDFRPDSVPCFRVELPEKSSVPFMHLSSHNVWWYFHLCIPESICGVLWFLVGKIPRRRKWQLTPVFLPGKSHGQRSLGGYSPWGCKRVSQDWSDLARMHLHHFKPSLPPATTAVTESVQTSANFA